MTSLNASRAVDAQPGRAHGGLAALVNPLSFRMSLCDRASRTAALVQSHGGTVFEVSDLVQIEEALGQIRHRAGDRLIIAGGDGTLQGAVSWLARHLPPESMPQLVLLSAGRTNYVAEDIGTRSHFLATLETVLSSDPERLHPVRRPTLKLRHPSIGEQHGFFLAGAMVDEVIRFVHDWQSRGTGWLRRRHAASVAGVAALALQRAMGRYRFDLPRLKIETDGLGHAEATFRFLLLSTLNHDRSLVDPYARRGVGPLRVTAIRKDAKRLPWRLWKAARGRFSADMNDHNGYISGLYRDIVIRNTSSIVLDGQEFELDRSQALRVSAGPVFSFQRP